MALGRFSGLSVVGITCALPGESIPIEELESPLSAEELQKVADTVGLRSVHRARNGQTAGDLCAIAAADLIQGLSWEPDSIDALIMVKFCLAEVTINQDYTHALLSECYR